MGYVTWWVIRGDHLAFMSYDGRDYLAQSLGENGHSLVLDYVIWSLGVWAVLEQLECTLGTGCVTLQALTGLVRRHMMGKIICRVQSFEGH